MHSRVSITIDFDQHIPKADVRRLVGALEKGWAGVVTKAHLERIHAVETGDRKVIDILVEED